MDYNMHALKTRSLPVHPVWGFWIISLNLAPPSSCKAWYFCCSGARAAATASLMRSFRRTSQLSDCSWLPGGMYVICSFICYVASKLICTSECNPTKINQLYCLPSSFRQRSSLASVLANCSSARSRFCEACSLVAKKWFKKWAISRDATPANCVTSGAIT